MASFQVEWKRSAQKELRNLPPDVIQKIVDEVDLLSEDPFLSGCRKLVGSEQTWRIRVGNYQVIYDVFSAILIIEIVRVAHRKDAYRRI